MGEIGSQVLEQVIIAAVAVLVPALLGLIVAKIKLAWTEFKTTQPDVAYALEEAAEMSVKAAEQIGNSRLAEIGKDKLSYATDIAEKFLKAKGLNIDLDLIVAAIEKAVFKYFGSQTDQDKE